MDYGHDLLFGTFITPAAQRPHHAVELAVVADRAGLDLPGGPPMLAEPNRAIDEAATAAGRDPSAVRRILTFPGRFARSRGSLLDGPPAQWAEELAGMALLHGVGTFVLGADEAATIERFAAEVVPRTRELVAAERQSAAATV